MNDLSMNYTGIGSLPIKTDDAPARAIDFVFKNFSEIPFWAQLPHFKKEEDMMLQFSQGFAGLKCKDDKYFFDMEDEDFFVKFEELYFDYETITAPSNGIKNPLDYEEILDKYAITKPYSNTIDLFLNELKDHDVKYVKGSVTGPFTYSTSLNDKEGKCAFYDETLRDVITKTLALKAVWQIKEFKKVKPNAKAIIFMDEPSISQVGSCAFITVKNEDVIKMLNTISSVIKDFGGISGVHCCGKTDWGISINAKVDIINFDAFSFTQSVSTFAGEISNFITNGGILAFGIVPTLDRDLLNALTYEDLYKKFEESIKYLTDKKIDKNLILKQCMITPSCGCGSLEETEAIKVMELTKKLSTDLRQKYSMGV